MKYLGKLLLVLSLAGCALGPQKVQVMPTLAFENLRGLQTPIELVVVDRRKNSERLGYRNAQQQGIIEFNTPLVSALGSAMQDAMLAQGINMQKGGEPFTKLTVQIDKLHYSSPDENWVSRIKMNAEISIFVNRDGSSFKKRFSANRSQDVATAPSLEFNEKYMNTLLSEVINKAINDRDVVNFLN
ncbi:MAG: YajG family lipoprotein [Bermanella sp.]